MGLKLAQTKGKDFCSLLDEEPPFFFFFLLEACCLSLLPATWSLRRPYNCANPCDMVMLNRTGSARRPFRTGVVVQQCYEASKYFPTLHSRCCWQPSCKKPAQGQSWPKRNSRDKKTSLLLTLHLRSVLLRGFLHMSQSNVLLFKSSWNVISVTWTWKHPKSHSREINSQRDQEKKINW